MTHALSQLVPDVFFASWLCFAQQRNVWATRRIQTSRVTTTGFIPTCGEHGQVYRDSYVDGEKALMQWWYSLGGQIRWENMWRNNNKQEQPTGTWRGWYKNGQLRWERVYSDSGNKSTMRRYLEDGTVDKWGERTLFFEEDEDVGDEDVSA